MNPATNTIIRSILAEALALARCTWRCAACGYDGTSMLSEICDACRVERGMDEDDGDNRE